MLFRQLRAAAVALVCLSSSACSYLLTSSQKALEKTTAQGSMVVPAGSADTACTPRGLGGGSQADLFITNAERQSLAASINAELVSETRAVTPGDSRALYRNLSTRTTTQTAVSDKAVQSAVSALDLLASPTHQKVLALMSLALSSSASPIDRTVSSILSSGPAGDSTLTVDRHEWTEYANNVATVSMTDGWTALAVYSENRLANSPGDARTKNVLTALQGESALISAYLAAYFRQGHFVALQINPSKLNTELQTKVNSWLKDSGGVSTQPSPSTLVNTVADDLLPSQCKASGGGSAPTSCNLIGSIGDSGFVTRSGDKYAFPALTFQVDPLGQQKIQKPQVDVKSVIADLVRVVIEASGDALYQLPAAQGSTACSSGLLSCYDPSKSPVSADNFNKVGQYSAEAETVASGAMGLLIRGGFWVALNNENLATAVETGVGVAARKAAERVAWDYLSCAGPASDFRTVAVNAGAYRALVVKLQ